MENLTPALVVIAILGFIALIIYWTGRGKYAEMQMLFETQKQILDKIGTGPEMKEFIVSKEGKEFFERLKLPQQVSQHKVKRTSTDILGYVTGFMCIGFIGVGVGVGLLIATRFISNPGLFVPGFVATGAGIGFLFTAWISYYLNKKWGIIKKARAGEPDARTP